ncbi:MAG: hypothetical protein ACRD11_11055 [Terriglobia bacterium]
MALLKRPALVITKRQYHIRIDEPLADKAERYAEFIDAKIDHVVSEALDYIFKKDSQFNEWLAKHPAPATTSQAETPKGKPNGTMGREIDRETATTARATI